MIPITNHYRRTRHETTHNKSFQNNLHPSPSSPLKTLFNALQVNKSSSRPRRRRRRETLKEISLERRNASEGGREERRRRGGRWGKGEKSRTIQPIGLHNSVLLEMREVRVPWFPAHKEPRPTISLSPPFPSPREKCPNYLKNPSFHANAALTRWLPRVAHLLSHFRFPFSPLPPPFLLLHTRIYITFPSSLRWFNLWTIFYTFQESFLGEGREEKMFDNTRVHLIS